MRIDAMQYITLYLTFSMFATLWLDVTRYKIPNWLVGSVLLLYPVAVYLSPHAIDWKMALLCMGATFIVGYIIFALKVMGGGDIKLITVLALWAGKESILDFIVIFALIGGVFSLILLLLRKAEPFIPSPKSYKTPRILQKDAPIPYGVAIAGAFLYLMADGKIIILH